MKYWIGVVSSLRSARPGAWAMLVLMKFALMMSLAAQVPLQAALQQPPTGSRGSWVSDKATHLIGLPEVKARAQGTLKLLPDSLVFTTQGGDTAVERGKVLSLSIGSERMERGGTMGKIARSAIPFGGGPALATVMGSQADLLTIEFRDQHDAYHGVVFLLPKDEAVHAREQFSFVPPVSSATRPQPHCLPGLARPATVKVAGIASSGEALPPEYKVLLYEHLMRRLHDQPGLRSIYRDGDSSDAAACPALTLSLTVQAFTKGNAVLRASTGPLGMLLGTTQLKFKMELRDSSGNVLLGKDLKASQRGDNESLELADDIAKSVSKKLKKANAHRPA